MNFLNEMNFLDLMDLGIEKKEIQFCCSNKVQKTMKKISHGLAAFLTLSLTSCTKENTQTLCPANPFTSQPLCGTWLNTTTSDSQNTETWTIKRTDKNYVEIKLTYNGTLAQDVTIPMSIGTDTTFTRYDVEAGTGSADITYKMSNVGDTLILTNNNMNPAVQKFIQIQ